MSVSYPLFLFAIPFILLFINKRNYLYMLSLIFLLLGASQIARIESKEIKYPSNRVYLLIDNSYSMSCTDLKPNRLEYAKKEIKRFLKGVNKDIAVFTFNKFLHPITFDKKVSLEDTQRVLDALGDDAKFAKIASNKRRPFDYIDKIMIEKTGTDITSAIDAVDAIDKSKKIIIVASDGGEKKVQQDFIFWGFATKKGAKVPGYDGVSRLNIIGTKYFRYDEGEKLLAYVNKLNIYSITTVKIKKDISFYFLIPAALLLLAALVRKYLFVVALLLLLPHNELRANDTLGCIFQFFQMHKMARAEFQKGNSDLAKLKTSIYYILDDRCKDALPLLESMQGLTKQKEYNTALCLVREKRYEDAYNKLLHLRKEYTDDKKIEKFFRTIQKYLDGRKRATIIYQVQKKHIKEKKKKASVKKDANTTVIKEYPW